MKKNLTAKTQALMGIASTKGTAVQWDEQQMFQAEEDFDGIIEILNKVQGKLGEIGTLEDLQKTVFQMGEGGGYDGIPAVARLADTLRLLNQLVKQANDNAWEVINTQGIPMKR